VGVRRHKTGVLALTALAPRGSGSDLEGFIDDEEGDEQLADAEVLACLAAARHKPDTELARPRLSRGACTRKSQHN
jgi:hypothetical protein